MRRYNQSHISTNWMTMKNNGHVCRKTGKRKLENFSMSAIWNIDVHIQNIAAPKCSTMSTTKHTLFQASAWTLLLLGGCLLRKLLFPARPAMNGYYQALSVLQSTQLIADKWKSWAERDVHILWNVDRGLEGKKTLKTVSEWHVLYLQWIKAFPNFYGECVLFFI